MTTPTSGSPAQETAVSQQRNGIRTTIVGNLAADPTIGYTESGNLWVRVDVASTERQRDQDGQWSDTAPTFTETVIFGKRAEAVAEMSKGDRVEVVGRPEVEVFTRRDGTPGAAMKVLARSIEPAPLPSAGGPADAGQEQTVSAGHITIHHNAEHTVAAGVGRADTAVRAVLKDNGFKWSAPRSKWYLPASMPAAERGQLVEAVNQRLMESYGTSTAVTDSPAQGTSAAAAQAHQDNWPTPTTTQTSPAAAPPLE